MKLFKIVDLEKALEILVIQGNCRLYEEVSLKNSFGRISYEDIVFDINIPYFNRSTVDSYALNHKSVNGVSKMMMIMTKVIENININSIPEKSPGSGKAPIDLQAACYPKEQILWS